MQKKSKPFSQKQKKQQLLDKRQRKRDSAEHSARPAPVTTGEENFRDSLFTSLGKSGAVNQLSTVFVKERKEDVMVRKLTSDIPLDMSKRGQPLHALVMPRYDRVLPLSIEFQCSGVRVLL